MSAFTSRIFIIFKFLLPAINSCRENKFSYGLPQNIDEIAESQTRASVMENGQSDRDNRWDIAAVRQKARSTAYNVAVTKMTRAWYCAWLERLAENSYVLAVGVGTGYGLLQNLSVIRAKNIRLTLLEHDSDYAAECARNITQQQCRSNMNLVHDDIATYKPRDGRLFDAVHLNCATAAGKGNSMTHVDTLRRATDLLNDREDGRVWLSLKLQLEKNAWLEWISPKLIHLSTVDFGNVLYVSDVDEALYSAGLVIISTTPVVDANEKHDSSSRQEDRLVETRSRLYVPQHTDTIN